jgi:hypothetical protein
MFHLYRRIAQAQETSSLSAASSQPDKPATTAASKCNIIAGREAN